MPRGRMVTTGFSTLPEDEDKILTGEESWPIVGEAVGEEVIAEIVKKCAGLNRIWGCLPKARIAREVVGHGDIVIGSLMVTSGDGLSEYGHYWNPPYEFHAWLLLHKPLAIVDVGLPGVIEKGLTAGDDVGPYLVDRKPFVLAGWPLGWVTYKMYEREQV